MNRYLAIIAFTLLFINANSQDLIVTSDMDSINCKITKVKTNNIYFTFKYNGEIKNTLLAKSLIKDYKFNYYSISEVPVNKITGYENFPHFRIALNGGYSYEIAKISNSVPDDFKDYVQQLKSGYHIGGDFTYYFSENIGVGFKYYAFKTSNSMDNIYVEDSEGNITYGKMSDDLTISFIGPLYSSRLFDKAGKNAFIFNFAIGYMKYDNDKVIINNYKMTGETFGMVLDVGYDIQLSDDFSLGFQISYTMGALSKYDIFDGSTTKTIKLESGNYESLHRIDFSIGIRFNK